MTMTILGECKTLKESQTGKTLAVGIGTFAAGWVLSDLMARRFAKVHNYQKRGGIFEYTPTQQAPGTKLDLNQAANILGGLLKK